MARLLLLIPTMSYRVRDFLRAAHRLGVQVAVGSNVAQVLEQYSDGGTVTLAFGELERGVTQILAYDQRYPLTAIVGVDDETILLAAAASQALNLPHNSPLSVSLSSNKFRFREAIAASGLPSPDFRLLSLKEDPGLVAGEAAYPCVLKPLHLSGSRGVIRVDDMVAFEVAFERIAAILAQADAGAPNEQAAQHILMEAFIPGLEVALEGLLWQGELEVLALFDKPDPLDGPFFEETLYVTPSRLPGPRQSAIVETTARAARVLGLASGPIHAELRVNVSGIYVIELAARSIGGYCGRSLSFQDSSLEDLILRQAIGMPLPKVERDTGASGAMMIPIPAAGKLLSVGGLTAARATSGIESVDITVPIGEELLPLPEGYRYLGFIIAKAETADDVEAALRCAHAALSFEIAPLEAV